MTHGTRKYHRLRAAALIVLTLSFALRSLIPLGFMPDRAEGDGAITIRICDAYGGGLISYDLTSGKVVKDEKGGPQDPASHMGHKSACPFAAGALFEGAQSDAALAIAFFGPPLLAGRPVTHVPEGNASQAPLPPRGPPAIV